MAAHSIETPAEVQRLAESTDPDRVGICLDVGHLTVAGGDPVATLVALGERVTHVHLKDVDPAVLERLRAGELGGFDAAVHERLFTELGAGMLDLDGVVTALAARDYSGWLMVEQDSSWGPPSESAAIGRRVLATALRRAGTTGPPPRYEGASAMKVALLGAGRIGQLHGRLLAATPGVDELFIADADPARAADLAGKVGATAAPSIEAALDAVDAVVIAAATTAHAELIRASIGRGRPTFCEKPLAAELDDSIALAAEIERSGIPFQLGFQRRFDPAYREARRMVESGELGTLYAVRLAGHDPAPPHESYIPQSGGIFRDFSIHDFDILRWLTGNEVEEVYADGGVRAFPVFAKYGDVDTAVATLRLTDGPFAVLTSARHDPLGYDIRAELFGSGDSISVGLGPQTPMRSVEPGIAPPAGPAWRDFLMRFESAYAAEFVAFLAVARGEASSPCTARDGVAALRIAEAATRSLHEHRPVRLEEIPG